MYVDLLMKNKCMKNKKFLLKKKGSKSERLGKDKLKNLEKTNNGKNETKSKDAKDKKW